MTATITRAATAAAHCSAAFAFTSAELERLKVTGTPDKINAARNEMNIARYRRYVAFERVNEAVSLGAAVKIMEAHHVA